MAAVLAVTFLIALIALPGGRVEEAAPTEEHEAVAAGSG